MTNLTDKELIKQYQEGDEISFNILFKRYEPLLTLYAYKMESTFLKYDNSLDFQHHISELSFKFYEAVKKCKIEKMTSESFKKRLHYFLRHYNQKNYAYINYKGRDCKKEELISYNDDNTCYMDYSGYIDMNLRRTEDRIMIENILKRGKKKLSSIEYRVLKHHFNGRKNKEIARYIKRTVMGVRVIKERIRKKLNVKI